MFGAALDKSNAWSGVRQKAMLVAALVKKLCYERRNIKICLELR